MSEKRPYITLKKNFFKKLAVYCRINFQVISTSHHNTHDQNSLTLVITNMIFRPNPSSECVIKGYNVQKRDFSKNCHMSPYSPPKGLHFIRWHLYTIMNSFGDNYKKPFFDPNFIQPPTNRCPPNPTIKGVNEIFFNTPCRQLNSQKY
jgi:hypothetical protein